MKTSFVSLLLCSLTYSHLAVAAGVTAVTGANEVLLKQVNNADKDVNNINAVNTAINGQAIPKDLQTIVSGFDKATASIKTVATTKKPAEEDQVTKSFDELTEALGDLTGDLVNKKTDLELLEGTNIEQALSDLKAALATYSMEMSRIVTSANAKDGVAMSSAEAYSAISDAQDEYKTETVPAIPK